MIIDTIINMLGSILGVFIDLFPKLIPSFPSEVDTAVSGFYSMVGSSLSFVNFLFPIKIAIPLLALVVIIENFDNLKRLTFWVLRKIPFLNIS